MFVACYTFKNPCVPFKTFFSNMLPNVLNKTLQETLKLNEGTLFVQRKPVASF